MNSIKDFASPFTLYDFFGYFFPGFFFLLILIIEYDGGDLMEFYVNNPLKPYSLYCYEQNFTKDLKLYYFDRFLSDTESNFRFLPFIALVMLSYLLGHVIASFSSLIFEYGIVNFILGYPSVNLLRKPTTLNWIQKTARKITHPFCNALEDDFVKDFEYLLKSRFGAHTHIRNYFWLCFTDLAKYTPIGYKRVVHFLNLYGFARNVSMCFLIYIVFRILILKTFLNSHLNAYNWLILGVYLLVSIAMFWNYIKLFRRQCAELYFHFYSLHKDNLVSTGAPQYTNTHS